MSSSLRQGAAWLGAVVILGGPAQAQEARRYAVPSQPMTAAALQLAVQGRVSIGAAAATGCGRSRAVRGTFDVETALGRMLAGSGCGFRRLESRSYIIERLRPPASRPRESAPVAPAMVTTDLDDVVVTATKQEIHLAGAPFSISALDGDVLDSASRLDTASLSTRLAGLTVTNLGPGRNKLFVRGLADSPLTGQTQAMVGLYLDDTRLTYDAPDPDLRLVDLERIELLRGPQGPLYGAGALGGVLKLVSRPPSLETFDAQVGTSLTFAENADPGHSLDAVVNAPILRDRLGLRVVVYEERLEGVVNDRRLGLIHTGRTMRNGGRASLLWRINPRWTARVGAVSQTLAINDSQYGFEDLGPYERALEIREPSNNDFNGVSVAADGDLGWARLQLSSAYQGHELDRRYDATEQSSRLGTGGPLAYNEADDILALAIEATLTAAPRGAVGWLAGLYVSNYTHERTAALLDLRSDLPLYAMNKRDETKEMAAFGEVNWSPDDRFKLTAGGRLFRTRIDTEARSLQGEAVFDAFQGELSDVGFATQAIIEYTLSERLLAYAQASQGYRVGGFNGRLTPGLSFGDAGRQQPYRQYRPDALLNYEAGVRWRLFDDRLSVRAAAFVVDWRSIQSDRISPDGLPFTANIGAGGNIGFEGEGSWRHGGWSLDANLMVNYPHLDRTDDTYPLASSEDLPGVPQLLGAASVRREGQMSGRPAWIALALGYVGRSTQQLTPSTVSAMGGYVTSEAAAAIDFGRWSATLRVDNLFDSSGDTFGYGNPFLVGRRTINTPQRPRSLSISLVRRF